MAINYTPREKRIVEEIRKRIPKEASVDIEALKDEIASVLHTERADRKRPVSIRLDPDIVEFFKKEGPGWQTRINMVLRSHMINQR